MASDLSAMYDQINIRRMRELLYDFVRISTPMHETAIASEWYAGCLRACGAAEVQIIREQPLTPCVIAGFPGLRRSPILEVHGNLGAEPRGPREVTVTSEGIRGPGLLGSKAELIAAAEAARVLANHGPLPGGGLLFMVTPRLAADQKHDPLSRLIARGTRGDVVLIAGGESRVASAIGRGVCLFSAQFFIQTGALGDTYQHASESPNTVGIGAIDAAHLFISLLRRKARAHARTGDPLFGAEQVTVSEIRSDNLEGDQHACCTVQGCWQWLPNRHSSDIFVELEQLAQRAAHQFGASVELVMTLRNEAYALDPAEPLLDSLRSAYQSVLKHPLPLGSTASSRRAAQYYGMHGIPAVTFGADARTRNTSAESISFEELLRLTHIYLRLFTHYLQRRDAATPITMERAGDTGSVARSTSW